MGAAWILAAFVPISAHAAAEGSVVGTLNLSITAPATLPPGFVLNPGGPGLGSFAFPNSGNTGDGSFTALGSADCTPAGCTSPGVGPDLQIQLASDLACTASSFGSYGGLEDSFGLFSATNTTGGNVELDLRVTTSWSVSASADESAFDGAEASLDILWSIPNDFCIELTSCPTGALNGGTAGACPAGFVTGAALVLASADVAVSMGDQMQSGAASDCDVTIIVLTAAQTGGTLGVTSSCLATSDSLIFADGFESGDVLDWSSSAGS